ncbi:G-protein beta WD-40 repeats containing protein [Reticulomyxa filosa]|uniref:G-protein beta WD-40 repeats containing protein n=1 Tax=Reticulomyxa filosa TaxID=46433 RepID=X6NNI0_RETFI|nr:G-protein beta WD-40 repeats containing protein [Reticulomyxa filosa]|eukprot:ETO27269.1 G-protein beta WD-40 repeats containing protein [Reticulomyxa filosa]
MVVSYAKDDTIRLWDVRSETEIMQKHLTHVTSVQFSPKGDSIVSSSNDGAICFWAVSSGQLIKKLEEDGVIFDIQFSPDGQLLVSSLSNNTIAIWNVKSSEKVHVLRGHSDIVRKAAFSSDGRFVVSCSSDNTIRTWDAIAGTEIQKFEAGSEGTHDVKFLPSGQIIVACLSEKVQLWDVKLKVVIQKFGGYEMCKISIDVSSDGNMIALSLENATIKLLKKIVLFKKILKK